MPYRQLTFDIEGFGYAPAAQIIAAQDMALLLNSGKKIQWPAGTNAIKIRFPNGKKTIVVRGDEDTLKGAGIDEKTSIVFGKVSFDRKGHPQRDQFKEIA
jgi:hypothetical protein